MTDNIVISHVKLMYGLDFFDKRHTNTAIPQKTGCVYLLPYFLKAINTADLFGKELHNKQVCFII